MKTYDKIKDTKYHIVYVLKKPLRGVVTIQYIDDVNKKFRQYVVGGIINGTNMISRKNIKSRKEAIKIATSSIKRFYDKKHQ